MATGTEVVTTVRSGTSARAFASCTVCAPDDGAVALACELARLLAGPGAGRRVPPPGRWLADRDPVDVRCPVRRVGDGDRVRRAGRYRHRDPHRSDGVPVRGRR